MSKTIEEQVEEALQPFIDEYDEVGSRLSNEDYWDVLKTARKAFAQALKQRDEIARAEERNRLRKNLGQAFIEYSNGEGKLRPFSWADFIEEVVTSNYYDK